MSGIEPAVLAALIGAGGSLGSSLVLGEGQEASPFRGPISPPNVLEDLYDYIRRLGTEYSDLSSEDITLPSAVVQQPEGFASDSLPFPIGLTARDPALLNPNLLRIPGRRVTIFNPLRYVPGGPGGGGSPREPEPGPNGPPDGKRPGPEPRPREPREPPGPPLPPGPSPPPPEPPEPPEEPPGPEEGKRRGGFASLLDQPFGPADPFQPSRPPAWLTPDGDEGMGAIDILLRLARGV